ADLCAGGPPGATAAPRAVEPPARLPRQGLGSARLIVGGFAVLLAGPRAALLVMLALGVLALLYTLVRPSDTVTPDASGVAGYAGRVPAPFTFGLIAAVALRHLDMAWRARNRVPLSWFMGEHWVRLPRADWRGFGWEGRMILAGIALMGGVTPLLYMALAAY